MLSVILCDREESYEDFVLRHCDEGKREERRELTKAKLNMVKSKIIGEDVRGIKGRFLVLVTSKQDFLDSISWEINEKQYASNYRVEPLRYATFRLQFKRTPLFRSRLLGLPTILATSEDAYSVCFDCDLTRVDDLIKVLQDARKQLEGKGGDD